MLGRGARYVGEYLWREGALFLLPLLVLLLIVGYYFLSGGQGLSVGPPSDQSLLTGQDLTGVQPAGQTAPESLPQWPATIPTYGPLGR